ncbi:hypothetical protein BDP27DRAFT_1339827, partial [Rhodocollybia butyracea]
MSLASALFREIDYRYEPTTPWTTSQLSILEETAFTFVEKNHGKTDCHCNLPRRSLENDTVYNEIGSFAHHLFIGKAQPSATLDLYMNASRRYPLQQAAAVLPWINFIDGPELRASPMIWGYQDLVEQRETLPGATMRLTGIAEAYAVAIFKSTRRTGLAFVQVYIAALPISHSTLSEELAEQSFKDYNGSGASGEWTALDTVDFFCNEAREALQDRRDFEVADCERIVREKLDSRDMGLSDTDVTIALSARVQGWVYFMHLQSPRYKLDHVLRPEQFGAIS